jgi:hypothetical protein
LILIGWQLASLFRKPRLWHPARHLLSDL